MPDQHQAEHQVLEVIVRSPGTALDDIVFGCPDLTWNQVFIAIDRMSREGVLTLSPKGHGQYAMHIRTVPQEVSQYASV